MSNLQVLKSNRYLLAQLGLPIPHHLNQPIKTTIAYCCLLITFIFGFISVLINVYIHRDDYQFVLDGLMITVSIPQFLSVFWSIRLNMKHAETLQWKLQNLVDEGIKKISTKTKLCILANEIMKMFF